MLCWMNGEFVQAEEFENLSVRSRIFIRSRFF